MPYLCATLASLFWFCSTPVLLHAAVAITSSLHVFWMHKQHAFFRNSLITFSKLTTIWAVSTETRCRHMKRRSRSRKVEGDDSVSRLQLSSWWGYQFFGRISIGTPPQVNKRFQLIIHSYLCKVMLKT